MRRQLNIYYRHVHSKADNTSRDPCKLRPDWFSYESCFRNLISTIKNDPLGEFVKITVMFDGSHADFIDDFISRYIANKELDINLQFLNAGSDKNSALITLDYMNRASLTKGNLVYMLENDYMHQLGWVSKVFELYDSEVIFDYLSLYDHRDKYFLPIYENLVSKLFHTQTQHWRTAPNSCGSFISEISQFRLDYEVFQLGLPDYYFFDELINKRKRVLLTPIPGLSTHCMEGYTSPCIDWQGNIV